MWSRGAHLTKPGCSKPHTIPHPTNLALFGHKITLYRFNQGAHISVVVKTFLGLETETETWTKWTREHSSLETMASKSHHCLHQFQSVTEHSLKGATNYGNRATGPNQPPYHNIDRPRPRPWPSGLETETWTKWTLVHWSLKTMVPRSRLAHTIAGGSNRSRGLVPLTLTTGSAALLFQCGGPSAPQFWSSTYLCLCLLT